MCIIFYNIIKEIYLNTYICSNFRGDFMLGIERRKKIMQQLNEHQKVYVQDLSRLFNVTDETIRRDLEKLEQQNLVKRCYGGAVINDHTSQDISFLKRIDINIASKRHIAKKAEFLVNDGDTLMIDASTTCLALLRHLRNKKKLTIITNSIIVINEFVNGDYNIISTGGNLRAHSYALIGKTACDTLKKYYVDTAIISCKALDMTRGIMESNEPESIIKQQMIAQSQKSILLADSTKFDKTAFTHTCELDEMDYIITDKEPEKEWMDFIKEKDIKVIL